MASIVKKDIEVLSEAFFCYYFAIWLKGKKNTYSPQDWNKITNSQTLSKWVSKMGIGNVVVRVGSDPEFKKRINLIPTFLFEKGWHERLVKQMNEFMSGNNFMGTGYSIMRADMIPAIYDPYKVYDEISQKAKTAYGFKGKVDKDKWNPSDVWIFSPTSVAVLKKYVSNLTNKILSNDEYKVGYLNALNNKIFHLYQKRQLYPVSLKAPGKSGVKLTQENVRGQTLQKQVSFTQLKYENNNQDAKIGFMVNIYDKVLKRIVKKNYITGNIKTKTVRSGGARLEIEVKGGGARYGSMGTENYQWIINETDDSGIESLNRLRNRHQTLKRKYWGGVSGKEWLGRKEYLKQFKKDPKLFAAEIEPYTQTLYKHLNADNSWDSVKAESQARTPEEAWLNKTHAGEVAVAVHDIVNKITRDVTVENLFELSASQRFGSGVRPDQLESRKNTVSKELGEDLEKVPPSEAKPIWEACFHIVVK